MPERGHPARGASTRRRLPAAIAFGLAVLVALPSALPVAATDPKTLALGIDGSRPAAHAERERSADLRPVTAATSAIVPGSVNRTSLALDINHRTKLTLRYGSGTMSVIAALDIRNRSGAGIDRFDLNTIAARLGRIAITKVEVDGRAVTPRVADQTIVVPLGGVLPNGATTTVRVLYHATLRTGTSGHDWLFTRANGIIDAYRWLPWPSRPHRFDRPNYGDPFVTPASSRVEVAITTDRPMTIATGARRVAVSGLTQTFVAENVRDFNLAASPYYRVSTTTAGDTQVRVYYRDGAPASTMRTWAARALTSMEALVGSYPYPTYTVAQTAGGYGMESPALTWIPTGVASSNLPYLISHETAHQWFYATVGNDQASEPYADEAAADFLARYTLGARRGSRCATDRLDRTIYDYSRTCYYEVVYIQGGNFLDDVRRRMGSTAFWRALRGYVAAHRFALAGTKTLLDTLDSGTTLDLRPSYAPRFPRYY
jgi:hypothetical protein